VAGAVLEAPEGVLLVCNRRRDGSLDWSPPGGVIDADERVLDGLAREVLEETGFVVTAWDEPPLYQVIIEAPDLGWHLEASVHRAAEYTGELVVEDPDGIVVDAGWVHLDACPERLSRGHPWVGEPLVEWLTERWAQPRRFDYRIDGATLREASVNRLAGP